MGRLFGSILLGTTLLAIPALAQDAPPRQNAHELPGHGPIRLEPMQPGGRAAPGERRVQAAPGEHGGHAAQAEHGGHTEHAEHDEKAPPPPMNWWHGLVGEKEGVAPGLLWRAPDEPPPFLATLINFGVLVFLVVRFGKKPLAAALVKRKETIMREIDDAQRLRKAAEERLREYEVRLDKIGEELERIRRDFREQGERDKERLVLEAKERRERMQKDTEILLSQESKQMRQDLLAEVVNEATRQAADILVKRMTLGDHDRFAEAFLGQLRAGGPIVTARKGGLS
jgi:F-type H+-transporting ATPase subunit b